LSINEIAARGFSSAADVYERARPGYAPDAVAWLCERLGIREGRTALDLGAGTGKLTRDLVPTGASVVAVEPLDEMRAHLEDAVPEAQALAGTAEEIPLPSASVDAVVCAQAFHWFDFGGALPEIHRVLRPSGSLALIWNSRDLSDELQAKLDELLDPFRPPEQRGGDHSGEKVDDSPLFGPVEHRTWPTEQRVSLEGLLDVIASRSYVASLGTSARAELLDHIRAGFADEEEPLVLRYVVEVFVADRA
jgi:SAM-dependent methyltransferase